MLWFHRGDLRKRNVASGVEIYEPVTEVQKETCSDHVAEGPLPPNTVCPRASRHGLLNAFQHAHRVHSRSVFVDTTESRHCCNEFRIIERDIERMERLVLLGRCAELVARRVLLLDDEEKPITDSGDPVQCEVDGVHFGLEFCRFRFDGL